MRIREKKNQDKPVIELPPDGLPEQYDADESPVELVVARPDQE